MRTGHFCQHTHKNFVTLLYYTAIRKSEGCRVVREDFRISSKEIIFDVGERLKHSLRTPPLNIPLEAEFVEDLADLIKRTKPTERVFSFSQKTAYNIFDRLGYYPHFLRLSRITNFFLEGWSIAQVRSWTGLSLKALDYYVGLVDVRRMGESLAKKREPDT